MFWKLSKGLMVAGLVLAGSYANANDDRFADVEITRTELGGSVYMLQGAGGNIGVSAGKDGILIVDDQFAPLAEKITAALKDIVDKDVRYIVNTHYHGDHTGANSWFGEHHHSTIFAHDNVRVRLASNPKTEKYALPVVTYDEGVKIHFNGETIQIWHLANSHTDGDSVIFFEQQNVLHMGDLFFNKRFPYVDLKADGSVSGLQNSILSLLAKIDHRTHIIPGHGPLGTKADLQNYLAMITSTNAIVQAGKAKGMSEDELVALGLGEQWQAWSWSFITEEKWIRTLFRSE